MFSPMENFRSDLERLLTILDRRTRPNVVSLAEWKKKKRRGEPATQPAPHPSGSTIGRKDQPEDRD